eukprot:COSAG01_NODE_5636_length_4126_cov_16.030047_1_plen_243_part_00
MLLSPLLGFVKVTLTLMRTADKPVCGAGSSSVALLANLTMRLCPTAVPLKTLTCRTVGSHGASPPPCGPPPPEPQTPTVAHGNSHGQEVRGDIIITPPPSSAVSSNSIVKALWPAAALKSASSKRLAQLFLLQPYATRPLQLCDPLHPRRPRSRPRPPAHPTTLARTHLQSRDSPTERPDVGIVLFRCWHRRHLYKRRSPAAAVCIIDLLSTACWFRVRSCLPAARNSISGLHQPSASIYYE